MLVPLKISIAYPRSDSSLDSSKLSWGILHSEYGLSQSTDPSLFSNRRLSDKTTVVESKAEVQNKHHKTEQIKEGGKKTLLQQGTLKVEDTLSVLVHLIHQSWKSFWIYLYVIYIFMNQYTWSYFNVQWKFYDNFNVWRSEKPPRYMLI